jgi:hypothetical protein
MLLPDMRAWRSRLNYPKQKRRLLRKPATAGQFRRRSRHPIWRRPASVAETAETPVGETGVSQEDDRVQAKTRLTVLSGKRHGHRCGSAAMPSGAIGTSPTSGAKGALAQHRIKIATGLSRTWNQPWCRHHSSCNDLG